MSILIQFHEINPFVRRSAITQLDPGYSTGYRKIMHYQMIYIYRGLGNFEINGQIYKASKGGLFFWGPAELHKIESDHNNPLVLYGVQFDFTSNHADNNYPCDVASIEHFDESKIHEDIQFRDFKGFNPHIQLEHISSAENLLSEIAHEYKIQKIYYQPRIDGLFKAFLLMIARQMISDTGHTGNHHKLTDQVILYIHDHLSQNLSNPRLSKIFNYHPNYLNRLMKLNTGHSLHQYIIMQRMNKAVKLLMETDMPVYEIAAAVGYQEIQHFSKLFKHKFGYPPSSMRDISR